MAETVMTLEQLEKLWAHVDDGYDKGLLRGGERGFEKMWWASLVRWLRGKSPLFRVWGWVEVKPKGEEHGN